MKQIIPVAIFACILAPAAVRAQGGAAVPVSAASAALAEQQISSIMKEQMLAANAHDTDRFMASYLHDSSLVFVYNGVVYNGWDNLEAQQLKWWNNGKSDVLYDQHGPAEFTVLTPDVVVAMSPLQSRRTLASGEVSTSDFAVTAVWQKRADGWKIVQAHESTAH